MYLFILNKQGVILGIVTLIIIKIRRDEKKGKSCGSGCSNCPSSSMCHK
ncbi:MAG: FeoB-associated Cys-rich membrane protein [Oscillospiraceae bacterium]